MRLTAEELARLDTDGPRPPALPGLGDMPTTVAQLVAYRRARLARG